MPAKLLSVYLYNEEEIKHVNERIIFHCENPGEYKSLVDEVKAIIINRIKYGDYPERTIAHMIRTYIAKQLLEQKPPGSNERKKYLFLMERLLNFTREIDMKKYRKKQKKFKEELESYRNNKEEEEEEEVDDDNEDLTWQDEASTSQTEETSPKQVVTVEELKQEVPLPPSPFLSFVEMQSRFTALQDAFESLNKKSQEMELMVYSLIEKVTNNEKDNAAVKSTLEKYIGVQI